MNDNSATPDDEDDVDTVTMDVNTGGRVRFTKDAPVRILELSGATSQTICLVGPSTPGKEDTDKEVRSDRKGYVFLKERDGPRCVRVHHRRVLPVNNDGTATVVESGDKFWAMCPSCGCTVEAEIGNPSMDCPKCSKQFPLHWLGVKPMADATAKKEKTVKAEKAEKVEKAPKAEKADKPARPAKVVKEPTQVDLAALAKLKSCELWTKKNVKFDHERIDVQAHVLLFTGDNPRKLCFNTYNGALGKKASDLPVEAFVAGTKAGKKDTSWFAVPDLDKARQKLEKSGYSRGE